MKIENLKDLEAVLKVCRKHGVQTLTIDNVSLSLGAEPVSKKLKTEDSAAKETPQPTEEELLFWSAQ